MSITLGIYDVFAYTIPGFLYLYLGYAVLLRLVLQPFSLFNLPKEYSALLIVLVIAVAYLLGHLLDAFADWFVFKLFKRQTFSEKVLNKTKKRYAELEIEFQPGQWGLLFSMLKNRHLERTISIDTLEANSIMLRNVSLGLMLLSLLNVYDLIIDYSNFYLIITVGLLVLSILARNRSQMFHAWFVSDIYEASLSYGKNMQEVVAYDERIASANKIAPPRAKSKAAQTGNEKP